MMPGLGVKRLQAGGHVNGALFDLEVLRAVNRCGTRSRGKSKQHDYRCTKGTCSMKETLYCSRRINEAGSETGRPNPCMSFCGSTLNTPLFFSLFYLTDTSHALQPRGRAA